uniref:Purple acid phosphatase n=1 Tax=Megaselia scalaris TaxID=36166 RepID=T1GWM5_MEGSC
MARKRVRRSYQAREQSQTSVDNSLWSQPMYCSNENDNDCTHSETLTRVGWPFIHYFGLEDLFYKYGVDVEIWAHEHSYERLWPIYDYKVLNGSYEKPYVNPKAPVHLVTGSAGCKEGREPFLDKIPEWSAYHSQDYGYTRMKAHNKTHLYFEQVSDDQNGDIIDSFWIIKDNHGSYSTSEIVVTWSTKDDTKSSVVEYGIESFQLSEKGSSTHFVDGGAGKHSQFVHRVVLKNLEPSTKYTYHCGSPQGWSSAFWFRTPPKDQENWSPRLAIFGDMGNENAQSLSRLQQDTQSDMYDAIIHVGDFAYDMNSENSEVGDEFMRQVESIAGYVPYMTCAGNHEEAYNFSNYRARFSMPGGNENLFFSFNLGPVHFIS